jgi:glycosyltransferase involved in cell wall biosynthesis
LEQTEDSLTVEGITTQAGADYLNGKIRSKLHVVPARIPDWDVLALPDLLARLCADVYHSPIFALPPVLACASVCTVHDVIPLARPDLTSSGFSQFFHRHARGSLGRASHVVTVSDYSRTDILRFFPETGDRLSVVYEPVGPMFRRRNHRECAPTLQKHSLRPGYLLYVGAVDRRKNLSTLLEAYASLCSREPSTPSLVLVGGSSGDGFDLDAEVQNRTLGARVRILGRVPDDEIVDLYSGAEVFVFPSLYEGFGLPVVEAMAIGVPVVTSATTSLKEVAGDAAVLVNPEDPDALRDGMGRILADASLRDMLAARGKIRARSFSLENQGRQLLAVYRRIRKEAG